MTCPKCGGSMTTFDRLGVHVEQCGNCKGIFLDYGELEQIVSAEQRHHVAPPPLQPDGPQPGGPQPGGPQPGGPQPGGPQPGGPQPGGYRPDSPRPYRGRPDSPGPMGGFGGHRDSPGPYRKRKKRSIFEELFD